MKSYVIRLLLIIWLSTIPHTVINAAEPIINFPGTQVTKISRQEVVWFYTLKYRTWSDGNKIKIVVMDYDTPVHEDFVRSVLGLTVSQYRKLIDTSINSGFGGNIIRVKSLNDMHHTVEVTPYSLGYISSEFLILRGASKDVKVLTITD